MVLYNLLSWPARLPQENIKEWVSSEVGVTMEGGLLYSCVGTRW